MAYEVLAYVVMARSYDQRLGARPFSRIADTTGLRYADTHEFRWVNILVHVHRHWYEQQP